MKNEEECESNSSIRNEIDDLTMNYMSIGDDEE